MSDAVPLSEDRAEDAVYQVRTGKHDRRGRCSYCLHLGHSRGNCKKFRVRFPWLHFGGEPPVHEAPVSVLPPQVRAENEKRAAPIYTEKPISVQDLPPPVVCGRCQQEGHDARDCPMRTTSAKAFYRIRQNGNGRSESVLEMKRALRVVANDVELGDAALPARPRTRGDCVDGPRPCPWVSCRHHLYLDVTETGTIRYPSCEVDEMGETCALDVADRGGNTLEVVGSLLRVTRERIRQVETMAVENAALAAAQMGGMEAAPEHGESPLAAAMGE